MHARIHRHHLTGLPPEELLSTGRRMLAAPEVLPGFVSFFVLDLGDDGLASVCICDDAAALDAVDAVAGTWVSQRAQATQRDIQVNVASGPIVLQRGL